MKKPVPNIQFSEISLTVDNLAPLMALVALQKWKKVWDDLLPMSHLETSNNIQEQSRSSAAYYINYSINPSWRKVYLTLYKHAQTNALERVKTFLSPTSIGK